ncbi:hypothetical protein JHK87_054888 [Glycine soja]|nr:hypothetical protein JHK87_054888 [Glycine soja]
MSEARPCKIAMLVREKHIYTGQLVIVISNTWDNKAFFSRFHSSGGLPSSYAEKEFWHEMGSGERETVEYGVNVEGSAFSCDPNDRLGTSKWNLKILTKHGDDGAFKFLAQKTTMFPPNVMLQHDVAVYKAVQKPGEFIITFPRAYHAGFSHGAAASRRYAHLRMMPLIPYEELLYKEAMLVYKSSRVRSYKKKPEDTASYQAIMLPFLHLMQS